MPSLLNLNLELVFCGSERSPRGKKGYTEAPSHSRALFYLGFSANRKTSVMPPTCSNLIVWNPGGSASGEGVLVVIVSSSHLIMIAYRRAFNLMITSPPRDKLTDFIPSSGRVHNSGVPTEHQKVPPYNPPQLTATQQPGYR